MYFSSKRILKCIVGSFGSYDRDLIISKDSWLESSWFDVIHVIKD